MDVSPENTRDNEWFFRAGADDWIYRKTFNVSEDFLKADKVFLVLNKIDTLAFVVLNDQEVDHSENAFLPFRRDVKSLLKPGENVLEVRICGPVAFVVGATKLIKTPKISTALRATCISENPPSTSAGTLLPLPPRRASAKTCISKRRAARKFPISEYRKTQLGRRGNAVDDGTRRKIQYDGRFFNLLFGAVPR